MKLTSEWRFANRLEQLIRNDPKLQEMTAKMVAKGKVMVDVRMQIAPLFTVMAESYSIEQQAEAHRLAEEERRREYWASKAVQNIPV